MSYRDPQRVIDDRHQRIAAGLQGFFSNVTKGVDAYKKRKADQEKKARKSLNKKMDPYADEEMKFMEKALSYSDDFKSEQRSNYQSMIDDNLLIIRNQLKQELSNPDLTNSQIQQIQLRGLKDLNTFSNRVQMMRLAHLELEEASSKEYGEAGFPTANKNPEFINILTDVKEGANFDLVNTSLLQTSQKGYKLGDAQYGVVLYKPDGDYEVENMVELEQFANMAQGESFFSTDEHPEVEGFNEFVLGDAMNDNRFVNQVERKNAKGKTVNQNVLNPNKLKYYLADTAAGVEMIDGMFDGIGMQGYLRSKKPKDYTREEWEAILTDEKVARELTVDFLVEDAIFKANPGTIYRNRDDEGKEQRIYQGFELEDDELNLFTETADQQ